MERKQNIVPLKELNLTDRFLFDETMEDPETHRETLSILLGKDISLLEVNETEKEGRVSPLIRSTRMDVYAKDTDQVVYNTEMQDKRKSDLSKRSRYYQAIIDTGLLEPGIPNYNLLNDSYIIMITPFDLFGYKKYRYTFESVCKEVPGLKLKDGATRIFFNTRGENDSEVSKELVDFLHYLEDTTDQRVEQTESERIKRIHQRVCKVRTSEEIGVKYMQAWEEKYYEREEGRIEGRKEGLSEGKFIKLKEQIQKKLDKKKTEEQIAEELEEDISVIQSIICEMKIVK